MTQHAARSALHWFRHLLLTLSTATWLLCSRQQNKQRNRRKRPSICPFRWASWLEPNQMQRFPSPSWSTWGRSRSCPRQTRPFFLWSLIGFFPLDVEDCQQLFMPFRIASEFYLSTQLVRVPRSLCVPCTVQILPFVMARKCGPPS